MTGGLNWGDIYNKAPEPLDSGTESLLAMIPEQNREMAEPMLKGYLANIKAQLSPEHYALYCADLKRGYEAHIAGDSDTARKILARYGIPYEMFVAATS